MQLVHSDYKAFPHPVTFGAGECHKTYFNPLRALVKGLKLPISIPPLRNCLADFNKQGRNKLLIIFIIGHLFYLIFILYLSLYWLAWLFYYLFISHGRLSVRFGWEGGEGDCMFLGRHSQGPCSPVRWLVGRHSSYCSVCWSGTYYFSATANIGDPLTVCGLWAVIHMWSDIYFLLISGLGAALNCSSTVSIV